MPTPKPLTERPEDMLAFLGELKKTPEISQRLLAERLGKREATINAWLNQLRSKGFAVKGERRKSPWRLTTKGANYYDYWSKKLCLKGSSTTNTSDPSSVALGSSPKSLVEESTKLLGSPTSTEGSLEPVSESKSNETKES